VSSLLLLHRLCRLSLSLLFADFFYFFLMKHLSSLCSQSLSLMVGHTSHTQTCGRLYNEVSLTFNPYCVKYVTPLCRRMVVFPLYRAFKLCQMIVADVANIFCRGRKFVVSYFSFDSSASLVPLKSRLKMPVEDEADRARSLFSPVSLL
jgi:hypothetical protein